MTVGTQTVVQRLATQGLAFLALSRVKFLGGAAVLYLLGMAAAWWERAVDIPILILGVLSMWGIQLMTHYFNEYWDLETDRLISLRTPYSGGSGVLVQGFLDRKVALFAAVTSLIAGFLAFLVLSTVSEPRPYAFPIFALAALIGWGYSSPPLRLSGRGIGEFATVLVVSFLVPLYSYHLQTGRISLTLIAFLLPLAFLQLAMLVRIALPDYEADKSTGRRSLVIRLGMEQAAMLHNLALVASYVFAILAATLGAYPKVIALFFLTLPFAIHNFMQMRQLDPEPQNVASLPFWGIALFMAAAALELLGFAIL